eukprot:6214356-Pleurochrysis_carterae.AAC.2
MPPNAKRPIHTVSYTGVLHRQRGWSVISVNVKGAYTVADGCQLHDLKVPAWRPLRQRRGGYPRSKLKLTIVQFERSLNSELLVLPMEMASILTMAPAPLAHALAPMAAA